MGYLIGFSILVVVGGVSTLFTAHVATTIWGWYLVPAGLPVIATWPVFGALLVYQTVKGVKHKRKDERPALDQAVEMLGHIAACFVVPTLLLSVAWLGLFFA